MQYLQLIPLIIPAIWIPFAVTVLSVDLWRHELARFAITTRLVIIGTLVDAIAMFLLAIYLVDGLRRLRTW